MSCSSFNHRGDLQMEDLADVAQALADALRTLREQGMQLPWHVVFLGLNGAAEVGRYNATEDPAILRYERLVIRAEHGVFSAPINVMVVDAIGDAARITLGPGEQTVVHRPVPNPAFGGAFCSTELCSTLPLFYARFTHGIELFRNTLICLASPRGFEHNSGTILVVSRGTLPARAPRRPTR
jgi:hypothetical protein